MRAPQIVSDFFEWRWAPCVALTVGSLAYVVLALLLIPNQIDGGAHSSDVPSAFDRAASLPTTAFAASLAQSPPGPSPTPREFTRRPPSQSTPGANDPMGAPRRGFSPPIEQPETPPPPTTPPPPAPAQAAPTPPVANIPPPVPPPDQGAAQPPTPPQPPPAPGDEAPAATQ
jgi:hypothetical protein